MLVETLTKREYKRLEIAEIMGLDSHDKNFATKVKGRLNKWGYGYEYSSTKVIITSVPKTSKEKLRELLIRKLDLDKQMNVEAFAVMLFLLANDDDFCESPWLKKEEILRKEYGIDVAESTMRNWAKRLIKEDIVLKEKKGDSIWRSYRDEFDMKHQERIADDDIEGQEKYLEYQASKIEILNTVKKSIKEKEMAEPLNPWKIVFLTLWEKYRCCYYSVGRFIFCAFYDDDFLEIFELVQEIFLNLPPTKIISPVPKIEGFEF